MCNKQNSWCVAEQKPPYLVLQMTSPWANVYAHILFNCRLWPFGCNATWCKHAAKTFALADSDIVSLWMCSIWIIGEFLVFSSCSHAGEKADIQNHLQVTPTLFLLSFILQWVESASQDMFESYQRAFLSSIRFYWMTNFVKWCPQVKLLTF